MTYKVFGGTLTLTQSINQSLFDKSDAVEGVPDQLKGTAMMFRLHSRHVELLLTY